MTRLFYRYIFVILSILISVLEGWAASPRKYGAFGDGVHDDTEALQECIAKERVINLHKGTYYVSSLTIKSSVRIKNGTILSNSQKNILQIIKANNVRIQNVVIDGNGTCENAVFASESSNITVKKCDIHSLKSIDNCTSGIYFKRVINSNISDCRISRIEGIPDGTIGNGLGASRSIILQQCKDINVNGNFIKDIISAEDGDGIQCIDEVDRADNRIIIENNDIKDCSRRLIKIQAPGIIIRNNNLHTDDPRFLLDYGISVFDSNVDIISNTLNINTPIPLSIGGTFMLTNVSIKRNTITDHGYSNQGSITIGRPVNGLSIVNNRFIIVDGKQSAIYILNILEEAVIEGNTAIGGRGFTFFRLDAPEKKIKSVFIKRNQIETSFSFMSIYADNDDQIDALSAEQNTIEINNVNNQNSPIYISSKSKTINQRIHYKSNNHKVFNTNR